MMFGSADFDLMPKYDTFKYWFRYNTNSKLFDVYDMASRCIIASIRDIYSGDAEITTAIVGDIENPIDVEIYYDDWCKFKFRPEYAFSTSVVLDMCMRKVDDPENLPWLKDYYETAFIASAFIRAEHRDLDPDSQWPRIYRCLEWLHGTDFYTAPASTKYHDNKAGGLLRHSIRVMYRIMQLIHSDAFKSFDIYANAIFVALVHDWCKIGLYESYNKNVKDSNGNWTQVTEFKHRGSSLTCFGHGVSSMFLVQRFFNLDVDEALAIRWHMSAYNLASSESHELWLADTTYPLVHLLQFADQLAIVNY